MGWLFKWADITNRSRLQIVCENIEEDNDKFSHKVVYGSQNGSVCYLACKRTEKSTGESIVYGLVVLTAIRSNEFCNFGMKEISEFCGPNYYCAPKKLIDMLSPTDHEWALEWRRQCVENSFRVTKRGKDAKILRELPLNTTIRVNDPSGTVVIPYLHCGKRRYKIVDQWARLSTKYILNYGFEIVSSNE